MTSKFNRPVVCPVLLGRETALENLRALAKESAGHGQVALISGEAGIGKTRLLNAFLAVSRHASHDAHQVRFFEHDVETPYAGIRRLLANLATGDPDGLAVLEPVAAELWPIAPDVFTSLWKDARPGSSAPRGVPEQDERRVVDAIRRLARSLCLHGETVLAFEDIHWADSSSLAAILAIARDANPGCLVVLTYRTDEDSPALRAFVAELDRERLGAEIGLSRLGLAEVDRMIAAILNSERGTRADVLHLVNRLSDGNPFFVEEVMRWVLERIDSIDDLEATDLRGMDVPRTVNEAVRRRTVALSAPARELLSLAAVAGVRFDLTVLSEISGRAELELMPLVKELIDAQLVTEETEDAFAFRHALTREAIRSSMLLREQRVLSGQIAEAIERRYAGQLAGHVDDLAWHFYRAGRWSEALDYCRQGGERALALYSPVEARAHFSRALEAGERLPGGRLARVFRLRGSANEAIGNLDAALSDYERAIELAEREADDMVRWQALIDLGLLWAARDYSRSEPCFRAALDLARDLGDKAALGHSLNRLGNLSSNQGDFATARQLSEEALAIFRESQDAVGVAQTLDLLAMTCLQGMQFEPAVRYYREAIDLLDALGDQRTLASALSSIQVCASTYQTSMLPPAISLAEGTRFGERGLALARQLGLPSAEAYALWQLAFALGPQGEYSQALTYAKDAERIAREIGHTQWEVGALCAVAAIFIDLLATEEALEYLHRAEGLCASIGSSPWAGQVHALLIDAVVVANQAPVHSRIVDPAPELAGRGFGAPILLAARGDLALANEQLETASELLEELTRDPADSREWGNALRVVRLRGRLAAARGDMSVAIEALQEAVTVAASLGNASFQWRLNADLARVLWQAGAQANARVAAGKAVEMVHALAGRIADEKLAAKFTARAMSQLPAVLRARPVQARTGVLTLRESEVAKFIARGMTSREIADRLVLSTRTVETHVENAMAKLGYTTRSQLAAWAAENGLLDE